MPAIKLLFELNDSSSSQCILPTVVVGQPSLALVRIVKYLTFVSLVILDT